MEPNSRRALVVGSLGLAAAALFYGDSVITPAISVLSAVEGLQVAAPEFGYVVVLLTIAILVLLFAIQRSGTALVGALFGPVMILWFIVLAVLGVQHILKDPTILWALSQHYAVMFFMNEGGNGALALGTVVLAVTGAEALYADMGHFGRMPIRVAWYLLVWPALLLNYFGQGAMLLATPDTLDNPLIRMAPQWAALPLVFLAMAAAIIASQAVISGAFSITQQAIQLGYLPRMHIQHTSDREMGQIYIPFVNWMLMISVVVLVLLFGSSSNLAAAYGIAVTGTMLITAILWHGDGPHMGLAAGRLPDRDIPAGGRRLLPGQRGQDPLRRLAAACHGAAIFIVLTMETGPYPLARSDGARFHPDRPGAG